MHPLNGNHGAWFSGTFYQVKKGDGFGVGNRNRDREGHRTAHRSGELWRELGSGGKGVGVGAAVSRRAMGTRENPCSPIPSAGRERIFIFGADIEGLCITEVNPVFTYSGGSRVWSVDRTS